MKWIVATTLIVGVPIVSGLVGYVNSLSKRMYNSEKTSELLAARLKSEEELMGHMVRAGENIKSQLGNHELMINELRMDLKYMKDTVDKILHILEKK